MDKAPLPHERRRFFRLRYPSACRPRLNISMRRFPICEISEGGLRFTSDFIDEFATGDLICGRVSFDDGEVIPVVGKVLRIIDGEIIVQLSKGIPMKRMVDEQKSVIRKCRRDLGNLS